VASYVHHSESGGGVIAELISSNEKPSVGLKVSVASLDMAFPKSIEEMEGLLTRHVLSCRHCLAMALFREEALAETGCDEYTGMLNRMHSVLRVQNALECDKHIDEDALEEYCFNRLTESESEKLEEHVLGCPECAERLEDRFEFIACMKRAVELFEENNSKSGISGALAVRFPEQKMNVYAAVGD
jgi:hypothetical protein